MKRAEHWLEARLSHRWSLLCSHTQQLFEWFQNISNDTKVALCRFIVALFEDNQMMYHWPVQALEASNVGSQCLKGLTATDLLVTLVLRSRKPWKTMESHEWHPWSILKPSQAIQRFLEAPMAFVSTWCAGKICVVKWYNPDHACLISYFRFELAEFLVGSDTCSLLPADQRLREVQCRWSGRARISEPSSRDQRFWLISPDFTSHDVPFGANSVQAQLRCVFWCFRYWLVKMPSLGLTHVP